ncbi:dna topoisomerase i [Cystoisospora suis]|uniref:DNA topoisomerase 1 n=1 Tax=Cystoisospora suis TaxID=483139 RepID=A0A2C6L6V3_9APIC|nr:dna topoisomerase i [Cystoisospora suis]
MALSKRKVLLTDGESSEEDVPLVRSKRPRPLSDTASPGPTSPAPLSSTPKKVAASCSPVSSPSSKNQAHISTGDLVKNVRTKIEDELCGRNYASSSSSPSPLGNTSTVRPALSPISPSPSLTPSPGYAVNGSLSDTSVKAEIKKEGESYAHFQAHNLKIKQEEGDATAASVRTELHAGGTSVISREIRPETPVGIVKKEETRETGGTGGGGGGLKVAGPPRSGAVSPGGVPGAPAAAKKNRFVKTEENFEPINRWWERSEAEIEREQEKQWTYLEHNGLMFAPPYEPHGISIMYKNVEMKLPPEAEEVANYWCGVLESDYATKPRFIENFWKAFLRTLPKDHIIVEDDRKATAGKGEGDSREGGGNGGGGGELPAGFLVCDFSPIKEYLDKQKALKKEMTKEEKEILKQQKLQEGAPYAYALVDFIREKVGNTRVEPPGLFRGRGEHPKQGMLKRRIFSEDVILNLAEDAPVPRVSLPGHAWKDVFHDNSVTWLAFYRDSINDQVKYMYLAAQSKFKGQQDFLKYEKARKLKLYVDKIREDYFKKMEAPNSLERQVGTATYLIDFLALRVGGEKDTDEEADTVGCCSLRVEHLTFDMEKEEVTFDFLGKDSIRYLNTVKIHPQAFKNIVGFCRGKKPEDDVFDKINSGSLNNHLRQLMPGLSAKVFRTYNASITLQNELFKLDQALALRSSEAGGGKKPKKMKEEKVKSENVKTEKVDDEDRPLIVAAAAKAKEEGGACLAKKEKPEEEDEEHRRKREEELRSITCDISNLGELVQFYNDANRAVAILCNHQRSVPKQHAASMQKLEHQQLMLEEDIRECEEYLQHLRKPKAKEFKFVSDVKDVQGNPRKAVVKEGMKEDACVRRLNVLLKRRADHILKMKLKDDNKTVALGTSKINYMDPRITVAFCKKYEIPIEKLFNKSLRLKFPWAMFANSSFEF